MWFDTFSVFLDDSVARFIGFCGQKLWKGKMIRWPRAKIGKLETRFFRNKHLRFFGSSICVDGFLFNRLQRIEMLGGRKQSTVLYVPPFLMSFWVASSFFILYSFFFFFYFLRYWVSCFIVHRSRFRNFIWLGSKKCSTTSLANVCVCGQHELTRPGNLSIDLGCWIRGSIVIVACVCRWQTLA